MEKQRISSASPSGKLIDIVSRLLTLTSEVIGTRLQLAVTELEEEKAHLLQLILFTGLTLLFTAFGIMSLLMYILLFSDPADQQILLLYVTGSLIALAVILGIVIRVKVGTSTLLRETRSQLRKDVSALTGIHDE
ncbi:phage holin family protein [Erwinia sp. S38]|uniref:phage holin family protein n=1 Tax=Erwinia sp. S38 TaxID=2769338 RepID=UPI00190DD410|nr:phage holin family protein [Erwinia sp. S38]MBK0004856.1 phage holin family protein [Erwinia sp. S38]